VTELQQIPIKQVFWVVDKPGWFQIFCFFC